VFLLATIPLTYRAICAASGKGGGPVATAALVLMALQHDLPNADVRYRGRMWMHCDPTVLESQVPLPDLREAILHLEKRGLITIRRFPPGPEWEGWSEGYLMCALTAKATRALAPNKWGYNWKKKESADV
jgi:hypothetical protein